MSSLEILQTDFKSYLTSPSYDDFEKKKDLMLSHVSDHFGLAATHRLEIYYDMYRLRLLDVLFADYPKLVGLMGEEVFTKAFLHYVLHYPSTHYSVRPFGKKLAYFLEHFEPFCFKPFYAEMAKFEWALSLTVDAINAPSHSFEDLKKLPPENWIDLSFNLHPSVSLLTFDYNIVSVWKELENQKILTKEKGKEEESILERYSEKNPEKLINALTCSENWIIWRKELSRHFQRVNIEEYFMLEAIRQGLSFSDICEKLTAIMPEESVPSFVITHISAWLTSNFLYIQGIPPLDI